MQHTTVTIGPKSQVVIPKKVRDVVRGIQPGKKVVVRPLNAHSVIVEVSSSDWVSETYGMMKEAWNGTDPMQELQKMRDEWERK